MARVSGLEMATKWAGPQKRAVRRHDDLAMRIVPGARGEGVLAWQHPNLFTSVKGARPRCEGTHLFSHC